MINIGFPLLADDSLDAEDPDTRTHFSQFSYSASVREWPLPSPLSHPYQQTGRPSHTQMQTHTRTRAPATQAFWGAGSRREYGICEWSWTGGTLWSVLVSDWPFSQSVAWHYTLQYNPINESLNKSQPIRYHRKQLCTSRFQDSWSHSKHWTTGLKPLVNTNIEHTLNHLVGTREINLDLFPTDCYSFKAIFLQLYKCSFWN